MLYSETQFDSRRQEGWSLLNEYSGKIPSHNQNCTSLPSFPKELWAGSDHKGSCPGGVGLLPQECLCFSSVSLRLVCVLKYVRHQGTKALLFASHPALNSKLTWAWGGISKSLLSSLALADTFCCNLSCLFYQKAWQKKIIFLQIRILPEGVG